MRFAPARFASLSALPATLAVALLIGSTLGGCAHRQKKAPAPPAATKPAAATPAAPATAVPPAPPAKPAAAPTASRARAAAPVVATASATPVERVPFRTGISTATVEKMARQQACTGGQGAGLVTEPGPVEIYRMQCDNGKVFRARCELRQCRQM